MNVYVVAGTYDWEGINHIDVFSTRELAQAYIDKGYADCDPNERSRPYGFDDLLLLEKTVDVEALTKSIDLEH